MKPKFHNRTRRSKSIPKRLIQEKKFHLIPLYYFLINSYLAKEAVQNSGSYFLADHIYKGVPQGRFLFGKVIDYLFLSLPSAKSFRNRYLYSKKELLSYIKTRLKSKNNLKIMSVPCGIPRDLIEVCSLIMSDGLLRNKKLTFIGMDLDSKALLEARKEVTRNNLVNHFEFIQGDAFNFNHYPKNIDVIVSTGLGEFLDDEQLDQFYSLAYQVLNKEGVFITSAIEKHKLSDFLLRELGEIYTNYRSRNDIKSIISNIGYSNLKIYSDRYRLQTMVIARK